MFQKAELLKYAKKYKIQWREDSTNQDDKYLRNYVRPKLVPKLSQDLCGIFGVLGPGGIEVGLAAFMGATLRHRGPDDEGYLFCNGTEVEPVAGRDTPQSVLFATLPYAPRATVARKVTRPRLILGHRRLSIIDLSPAGHQPMSYRDRYWLVFQRRGIQLRRTTRRTQGPWLRVPNRVGHRSRPGSLRLLG